MTTLAEVAGALRASIVALLEGDTVLMARVSGIYDDVPQEGTALPYITISELAIGDRSNLAVRIAETEITLTIWSDYAGGKEALEMAALTEAVVTAAGLPLSAGAVHSVHLKEQRLRVMSDGVTRRLEQRYCIVTEAS